MTNEVKSTTAGNNKNIVIATLLVIVFAGIGFAAGMKFQQKRISVIRGQFPSGQMQRGTFGGDQNLQRGRNGNGMTNGEIIGVDERSVTVKMLDGGSKVVLLSSTTTINKSSEGSTSDLKTGEKVAVFGNTNSDGSLTAQSIQLNPVMRALVTLAPTK